MATDTILKTKLFIPPLREGIIPRPELIKLINQNIDKQVVLVSAPAGFGKSTLLAEWAAQSDVPVAWLSLDKGENDPATFLTYLLTSVQTIYPDIGDVSLGTLKTSGSPPVENLLGVWINEITELTQDFVLVLDDFHLIQSQETIDLLCNLTDHQPPQLHLLFASRADLPACLARPRVRGDMLNLGVTNLRFTKEETIDYLKGQLGDKISIEDARILNERTEGWIAGLQMAVLSMRSSADISHFVMQFSAQDRYISDYLLDEVLVRQEEATKDFLLATSILNKFSASLCDNIIGIQNSQDLIQYLEHSGLFIIPLDTTRTWYRYHHLFAELLRKRLDNSNKFSSESLHRRASEWFANEEMLEECVEHAFAIEDYGLVIKRIENALNQIMAQGQFRNYLAWIARIPKAYLKEKTRLEILKVFMLHQIGNFEERNKQLELVDNLLKPISEDLKKYGFNDRINYGILASIKAIIFSSSYFLFEETSRNAAIAIRFLPEDYMFWRTLATITIPFLYREFGNYEKAIEGYNEVIELIVQAGFIYLAFVAYSSLARAYLETGKLRLAIITCQKALDMDVKHGGGLPFARFSYLIMGELTYHEGRLDLAEAYIKIGLDHVVRHGDAFSIIDGYATFARIRLAKGDPEQALAVIQEMKLVIGKLAKSDNVSKIMNAWEANMMIFAGNWEQAKKSLERYESNKLEGEHLFDLGNHTYGGIYRVPRNPITLYSDIIRMTTVRLHIASNNLMAGLNLINEVLLDATQGGRKNHIIESLLIKSILLQKLGQMPEAINAFHEAIHFGAGEGFVQIFMNEGVRIRELLEAVKETGIGEVEEQVFVIRLLENIQLANRQSSLQHGDSRDLLTQREIEVLECLAYGISYSQAAERLSISPNTLKTYAKRIYQKLGVSGLVQALNKARELHIIE